MNSQESLNIVVLDGFTLTPHEPGGVVPEGEPEWSALESLGALTVHPRTAKGDVVERAAGAAVVLTNKAVLDAEALAGLPDLKYVGVLATGTNVVDLAAAKKQGVVVTNVPAYSSASVAQHVFALAMELTNRVADHSREVEAGGWANSKDFCFTLGKLTELEDKTLGVVGAGDIGQRVLRIGEALGMKLAVHSRSKRELGVDAQWLSLDELAERSDVISLHCPLTDETHHMINSERLSRMKRSAVLINTGRGPLVDEEALADALNNDQLGGAGLDVLSSEPPAANNPLIGAKNCVITPHIAWASVEARHRLMNTAVQNVQAFLNGSPVNVVNG